MSSRGRKDAWPWVFFMHACVTVDDHILSLKNAMSLSGFDSTALPTELKEISTKAVDKGGYELGV